jgi:hypothetical protein
MAGRQAKTITPVQIDALMQHVRGRKDAARHNIEVIAANGEAQETGPMKKSPLVLMALNGFIWGGLSWMGWDGIRYIESQHAAGYPNTGQIGYYLATPLVMLAVSLLPLAVLGQTKWSAFGNVWGCLTLLVAFLYLIPYGGGV